jgi:tripartite motif-containing protein 71
VLCVHNLGCVCYVCLACGTHLLDASQIFDDQGKFLHKFGGFGTAFGRFDSPKSLTLDSRTGNIIVCDSGNSRVQIFGPDGTFIVAFGSKAVAEVGGGGAGNGQFWLPRCVCVDHQRRIWVGDHNKRIQAFSFVAPRPLTSAEQEHAS